jgi:hypothetical protein
MDPGKQGRVAGTRGEAWPTTSCSFDGCDPPLAGKALASVGVPRQPSPLWVGLLLHAARPGGGFPRKTLAHDLLGTRDRRDRPRSWARLTPGDETPSPPLEPHAHRTAHPPSGQACEQQALHEAARGIRDEGRLAAVDPLTATVRALVVLFAGVQVTVVLGWG